MPFIYIDPPMFVGVLLHHSVVGTRQSGSDHGAIVELGSLSGLERKQIITLDAFGLIINVTHIYSARLLFEGGPLYSISNPLRNGACQLLVSAIVPIKQLDKIVDLRIQHLRH